MLEKEIKDVLMRLVESYVSDMIDVGEIEELYCKDGKLDEKGLIEDFRLYIN